MIFTILNSAVVVALIVAALTFKQKLKEDIRKSKEDHYLDFIDSFPEAIRDGKDADENTKKAIKEACVKFSHVYNRILLIGSSAVVSNMINFHKTCIKDRIVNESLLTELVKSMRIDLYEENKKFNLFFFELRFKALCNKNINKDYPTVNLIGKK